MSDFPFLAGFGSIFWGCILSIIAFPLILAIIYIAIKLTSGKKAFPISLSWAGIISSIIFCIVTWMFLGWSFERPPTPNVEPSVDEISGTYDFVSAHELKDAGYQQIPDMIQIAFLPDGTFTATNLPDLFWYEDTRGFHSGAGNWKIYAKNGIELVFMEIDGVTTNSKSLLSLYGEKPPYIIYKQLGDELHVLGFKKVGAPSP